MPNLPVYGQPPALDNLQHGDPPSQPYLAVRQPARLIIFSVISDAELTTLLRAGIQPTIRLQRYIGEEIAIQAISLPNHTETLTNVRWSIGGEPIKDYSINKNSARKTLLTDQDRQQTSLKFFWPKVGKYRVEVTAQVGKESLSSIVNFDIISPIPARLSSKTNAMQIIPIRPQSNPGDRAGADTTKSADLDADRLSFGNSQIPGIIFNVTSDGSLCKLHIALCQLISIDRVTAFDKTNVRRFTSNENRKGQRIFVKDQFCVSGTPGGKNAIYMDDIDKSENSFMYWVQYVSTIGFCVESISIDTPSSELTHALYHSIDDQFKTYLMIKVDLTAHDSSSGKSYWVTLCRLDWHCKGTARHDGSASWKVKNWSLDEEEEKANSINPVSFATDELPEWTSRFGLIRWKSVSEKENK